MKRKWLIRHPHVQVNEGLESLSARSCRHSIGILDHRSMNPPRVTSEKMKQDHSAFRRTRFTWYHMQEKPHSSSLDKLKETMSGALTSSADEFQRGCTDGLPRSTWAPPTRAWDNELSLKILEVARTPFARRTFNYCCHPAKTCLQLDYMFTEILFGL